MRDTLSAPPASEHDGRQSKQGWTLEGPQVEAGFVGQKPPAGIASTDRYMKHGPRMERRPALPPTPGAEAE